VESEVGEVLKALRPLEMDWLLQLAGVCCIDIRANDCIKLRRLAMFDVDVLDLQ